MSTLQERLDRIREGFEKQAPAEALAVMARATQGLRDANILERLAAPGDSLPPFELPDSDGALLRSADLVAQGPLVLTIYRGVW